jgi:hypothetical protein
MGSGQGRTRWGQCESEDDVGRSEKQRDEMSESGQRLVSKNGRGGREDRRRGASERGCEAGTRSGAGG